MFPFEDLGHIVESHCILLEWVFDLHEYLASHYQEICHFRCKNVIWASNHHDLLVVVHLFFIILLVTMNIIKDFDQEWKRCRRLRTLIVYLFQQGYSESSIGLSDVSSKIWRWTSIDFLASEIIFWVISFKPT